MLYSDASEVIEVRVGSERRRSDLIEAIDVRRSLVRVNSFRGGEGDSLPLLLRYSCSSARDSLSSCTRSEKYVTKRIAKTYPVDDINQRVERVLVMGIHKRTASATKSGAT